MFSGCTSLTIAPELPATTLEYDCYNSMFSGCTSLTTAPELPAATLVEECYFDMFNGCTKLNYVKALFTTTPSDDYTWNWLTGVSSTGTFVKSKDATWNVSGTNGIPEGWTVDIDGVTHNGHEYVDLGLPSGTLWATMNVGAAKSTDYGDYFAWGEVTPKSNYNWSTYKYCNGSSSTLTKYCNSSSYGNNGYTDSKTVLDSIDDAASVNWGGSWRMPTYAELNELKNTDNCTWTWYPIGNADFNGIAGYKVISKKIGYTDKFIFLPVTGMRVDTSLYDGSLGYYWSSSLYANNTGSSYYLYLSSSYKVIGGSGRDYGLSIRPVCQ